MSLPLLERAIAEADPRFVLASASPSAAPRLIPSRQPGPGEQYRFHFDMAKCIGCKCCEVACNEQNGNPAHIHWRRVGEIEAGEYPFTQRLHLSMGCNHCVEPACLKGCPVEAYSKDALTGLVLHSADACIGCQYCTWNCPYGVPQFNEERGVVGKCDMCHGRLQQDREPACVNACPEQAIQVEIVSIDDWKLEYALQANAPGLPPAETTISTTRITRPARLAGEFEKGDYHRVQPEHPHWPLVFMLVLTQLSVGAFATLLLSGGTTIAAVAAFLAGQLALVAATAHLGRPIHAYRALRMWKRSWLSREIVAFSAFAGASSAYAGVSFLGLPFGFEAGLGTVLTGLAGIYCSARIYVVPARPAWNSWMTVAEYFATALVAGPVFAAMFEPLPYWRQLAWAGIAVQAAVQCVKLLWLQSSSEYELRQSGRLLRADLWRLWLARMAALAAGALALTVSVPAAFVILLAGEICGRYLFFVSVVPRNMAATFLGGAR